MLTVWFRVVGLGRSWVRVPSLVAVVVAVLSVVVLVVSGSAADASPVLSRAKPKAAAGVSSSPVLSRGDLVSARITARVQKSRVEVLDAETASSRTFVNPDGTTTVEASAGPVRVKQADGSWAGVDLGLVKGKRGWSPAVSPAAVTFSPKGRAEAPEQEAAWGES